MHTVIYSGCSVSQSVQCGDERVAIAMDPIVATLWRDLGASWSAISSRIVSAHRQLHICLTN